MKDNLNERFFLKKEAELAYFIFTKRFKKTPKGIHNIYEELCLSNDTQNVKALHTKFFGYLKMSKNAKEKWKNV